MIQDTHQEMVTVLVKPPEDILESLTPKKVALLHMVSKLCSEAGELMDAVGKHIYYNKDLDIENCLEELGDIEFYLEGTRQVLGMTRNETLQANYDKLSVRYNGLKYSDKAAIDRADKAK